MKIKKAQMFSLLISLVMLPAGIATASPGLEGPVVDAVSFYNQAVDAAENGSYEEALVLVDKSLQIKPDFYLAQITKAGLLSRKGDYDEAEVLLKKAEQNHKDNPYILAAMASLYIETGEYQKALDAADSALENDPSLVEAWVLKGTSHGGLGEFEEEKLASKQALLIDPSNPEALSNYHYATQALMDHQNKNDQGYAGKAPLSIPVLLAGVLFALGLLRVRT